MIDACASFYREGFCSALYTFVDSEYCYLGKRVTAEMHRALANDMSLPAIPFIKHKHGWSDGMMATDAPWESYHVQLFLQHPDVHESDCS